MDDKPYFCYPGNNNQLHSNRSMMARFKFNLLKEQQFTTKSSGDKKQTVTVQLI